MPNPLAPCRSVFFSCFSLNLSLVLVDLEPLSSILGPLKLLGLNTPTQEVYEKVIVIVPISNCHMSSVGNTTLPNLLCSD